MRYLNIARVATGILVGGLLATSAALAQGQPQPATMTDTAPAPATERNSLGAVILMDEPVLAQREMMLQAQARYDLDTRAMGAGPVRVLRGAPSREELRLKRALDAAERQKGTPN